MSRFLLLDIGAGTMDVLYYDDRSDLHYKAVVRSPVRDLAEQIAGVPGNLVLTGGEMGGGPVSSILKQRAAEATVVMTPSAAATIHHDPDRVRSAGIDILEDEKAVADLSGNPAYHGFTLGDLQMDRIEAIVKGFGVPFSFDAVGICAQDHGVPPPGVSHLDYRHSLFREKLDSAPYPHTVLFKVGEIPRTLNRLATIAGNARSIPTENIYIMDSGMAAILGASADIQARGKEKILVLDVATSHTVGAALSGEKIAGFFEYHTHDITLERLEFLIRALADGNLSHEQILKEGGHGAYTRDAIGFRSAEIILATGPKRRILKNTTLPIVFGAPLGDNMMTGTLGLLEAIRKRESLSPITHL